MHAIDLSNLSIRTDLIIENKDIKDYQIEKETIDNITVEKTIAKEGKAKYTTISYEDVTDKDNFQKVEQVFTAELKKYLSDLSLQETDPILIVGLGNSSSTPDSLGPETIKQVLVTRYLFELGEIEKGYMNTSAIIPDVTATTGIETSELVKSVVKTINAKLLIIIDALAASSITRLNKTIQLTNTGIHPGSGVGNNRKELSEDTLHIPVIAIGVPTVVDATTIVSDTFKYIEEQFAYKLANYNNHKLKLVPTLKQDYRSNKNKLDETNKKEILGEVGLLAEDDLKNLIFEVLSPINYNLIVTPTEIDFQIKKIGLLLGNGINKSLHASFNPTNN